MMQMQRTQNETKLPLRIGQPVDEVTKFMKNYFDAVHAGDTEEVNTYYANGATLVELPLYVQQSDEAVVLDNYLATYSCSLKGARMHLTFVLDKSEGYWQIIHGELQGAIHH